MNKDIYWNDLWLNVSEFCGKKSHLPESVKNRFYDLIEHVIIKKGDCFLTSEDLEREYVVKDSNYSRRHYDEVKKLSRFKRDYFVSKHNLYQYNQELVISLEDINDLDYMFLMLLHYSFNSKSIPNRLSWFEYQNSILGYSNDDSSKFTEIVEALMVYKQLLAEDLYKDTMRQLGGAFLLDGVVPQTNIQINNSIDFTQNNNLEINQESFTYNETVQNFYPDHKKDEVIPVISLNDFILHNCESSFKLMLDKLQKRSILDDKNVWQKDPLDLIALFGLIRSLGWCVEIGRNCSQSLKSFGEFLSTYFGVKTSTVQGYMKSKDISSAIDNRGKLFKDVFVSSNWNKLIKMHPKMVS